MYITESDCTYLIKEVRLRQLLDEDITAINKAANTAIAVVRNALHRSYDADTILAKQNDERDAQVMHWCNVLTTYYLYSRLPDKLIPEGIIKDYDEVKEELKDVENGIKSVDLPLKVVDETTQTRFRWGSVTPRSH